MNQIEPLTEQQIVGICGLQQSTHEAEEALSQGLEALNQSLSDSIVSDSLSPASAQLPPHLSNFMSHMSLALNKLSSLEGFVLQVNSNFFLCFCNKVYTKLHTYTNLYKLYIYIYDIQVDLSRAVVLIRLGLHISIL